MPTAVKVRLSNISSVSSSLLSVTVILLPIASSPYRAASSTHSSACCGSLPAVTTTRLILSGTVWIL